MRNRDGVCHPSEEIISRGIRPNQKEEISKESNSSGSTSWKADKVESGVKLVGEVSTFRKKKIFEKKISKEIRNLLHIRNVFRARIKRKLSSGLTTRIYISPKTLGLLLA